MTINVSLNQLANLQNENTAVTQINQNSNTLTTAFVNALNTSGDQMKGTLDMNSNQIVNLPIPATANSPARLQDISTLASGGTVTNIPSGGASGQVLTKSGTANYAVVWGNNASGSVNITAGTGLTLSGSTVSVSNTAVASGSYGAAASVPVLTINAQGQITSATTVAASGGASSGAASGTYGATGTTVQVVVSSSGIVTSVTSVSIGIAGNQIISGTVSGSVMSSVSLGAGNVNGGVNGSLPFTNMVGTDIAVLGTVTTGTWSASSIALSKLASISSGTFLGNFSGTTTYPSALATSTVLSVLGIGAVYPIYAGINFNSPTTDNGISVVLPLGYTRYIINNIVLSGANNSLTTATFGVFTAISGGGITIVSSSTAITISTATDATVNNTQIITPIAATTRSYSLLNYPTVYFRTITPQGTTATANVIMTLTALA